MRALAHLGRNKIVKVSVAVMISLLLICIVIALVWLTGSPGERPAVRKENGVTLLNFSKGDKLEGQKVYDWEGKELDVSEMISGDTLVIFAMKGCRDCIEEYPSYRILLSLYQTKDFSVVFLWDDEIPQKDLDEMGIPPQYSYSAGGNLKFTDWVPSYYFVGDNKVIRKQTMKMKEVTELLPEITVEGEQINQLTGGRAILAGLEGCSACKKAEEKLQEEEIPYCYILEGKSQIGSRLAETTFADPYKILSKAFHLDSYPVIIAEDKNGNVVLKENLDFSPSRAQ